MTHNAYVYAVEFLRGDTTLPAVGVTPDFAPAIEAARFAAFRRGVAPEIAFVADVLVEPRWHETLGAPYIAGLSAVARCEGDSDADAAASIPLRYFSADASAVSATFVQQGLVVAGESLSFLVTAYHRNADGPAVSQTLAPASALDPVATDALQVEHTEVALEVKPDALGDRLHGATAEAAHDPDDVAVLVPESVLEEAKGMAHVAEDIEVGGFLVGHLCRDTGGRGDVFLDVTDILPARHTQATVATLTFTPDTWWDARAALALRKRGESILGWVHTHPVTAMCRRNGCSEEAQRRCPMAKDYFSEHDRFLHRAMFGRGHMVALVVNDWHFEPTSVSLFGHRQGLIEPRGFHVVAEAHASPYSRAIVSHEFCVASAPTARIPDSSSRPPGKASGFPRAKSREPRADNVGSRLGPRARGR